MKKVVAIMIASLMFFWAQPSTALVVASADIGSLPLPMAQRAAGTTATRSTTAEAALPHANKTADAPSTYGLLALGLLAVALRRQQLMQRRFV